MSVNPELEYLQTTQYTIARWVNDFDTDRCELWVSHVEASQFGHSSDAMKLADARNANTEGLSSPYFPVRVTKTTRIEKL